MKQLPTTGIHIAVLLIALFMAYLTGATFFTLPAAGAEFAKTIIPFLLGVIATLVGFYWGNSHKGQPPANTTEKP